MSSEELRKYRRSWISLLVACVGIVLAAAVFLIANTRTIAKTALNTLSAHPEMLERVYRAADDGLVVFGRNNQLRAFVQFKLAKFLFKRQRYLESIEILNVLAMHEPETNLDLQARINMHYLLASDLWFEKNYPMAAKQFEEVGELLKRTSNANKLSAQFDAADWQIKSLLRCSEWDEADRVNDELKEIIWKGGPAGEQLKRKMDRLSDDILRSESKYDEIEQNLSRKLKSGYQKNKEKLSERATNRIERRLGAMALTRLSFNEAQQHFDKALQAVPNDGYSLWRRGICYDFENRPDFAERDYAAYLKTQNFKSETDNYRYREVAEFKKYCANDYFAAEACRGYAGRWPSHALPLAVYIPIGFDKNSFEEVTKSEIIKCLNEWCQSVPNVLSYKLVSREDDANLVFVRVQSTYLIEDTGTYEGMTNTVMEPNTSWEANTFKQSTVRFVDFDLRNITKQKLSSIHRLYLHEIGHALGLRTHSPNANDVMFPRCMTEKLSFRDIATIQKMYSQNLASEIKSTVLRMASQGCALAQLCEAKHEMQDPGTGKNWKHALLLFKSAYEEHLPEAATQIGLMYMTGDGTFKRDNRQALNWFQKASNEGDAFADSKIGDIYESGLDVEKDLAKSVFYYRKAANKGSVHAQTQMGYFYRTGHGVEKDNSQSFQWFSKAAAMNDTTGDNANAQAWIGYYYQYGGAVPIDRDKARFWYGKAASKGSAYAASQLEQLR